MRDKKERERARQERERERKKETERDRDRDRDRDRERERLRCVGREGVCGRERVAGVVPYHVTVVSQPRPHQIL